MPGTLPPENDQPDHETGPAGTSSNPEQSAAPGSPADPDSASGGARPGATPWERRPTEAELAARTVAHPGENPAGALPTSPTRISGATFASRAGTPSGATAADAAAAPVTPTGGAPSDVTSSDEEAAPDAPGEGTPTDVAHPLTSPLEVIAKEQGWGPPAPTAVLDPGMTDSWPASDLSTVDPATLDLAGAGEPEPEPSTRDTLLALLLPARVLTLGSTARDRLWGWLGPLLVTVLGGVLRFVNLDHPHSLVFDETYYVKNAYTLAQVGIDADWPENADVQFNAGNTDIYLSTAQYTVHPPIGKWLISLGIDLGGVENAWAWRLATAVLGTLAIFVLARTARRLLGSTVIGVVAGGLLAVDGLGIVMSRTALLDNFLMFFVLVAFACLVLDRDRTRRKLAESAAGIVDSGNPIRVLLPTVGVRWWRLAAGVSLGLACGVKWSGLYYVAAFGLLTVFWDLGARRIVRGRRWGLTWLLNDAVPAAFAVVVTAGVVYLASWWAWFTHPASWGRDWAANHPAVYPSWLPDWGASALDEWRSFVAYHAEMYQFHTHLTSHHDYMSNPWLWLFQWRPTSFYWDETDAGIQAVTSIGNPLLWWSATVALVLLVVRVVRRRDSRAVAIVVGVLAGWVPWLYYAHRTIFTFYAIAFLPFMALALAAAFGFALEDSSGRGAVQARRRRRTKHLMWWLLGAIVLFSAFWYPIWTAVQVPRWFWEIHMWLPSWI